MEKSRGELGENIESPVEESKVRTEVEAYLVTNPLTEVSDTDIDTVLTKLIESGPELDPSHKNALRKTVEIWFGRSI